MTEIDEYSLGENGTSTNHRSTRGSRTKHRSITADLLSGIKHSHVLGGGQKPVKAIEHVLALTAGQGPVVNPMGLMGRVRGAENAACGRAEQHLAFPASLIAE
jgi:hypothetical protein